LAGLGEGERGEEDAAGRRIRRRGRLLRQRPGRGSRGLVAQRSPRVGQSSFRLRGRFGEVSSAAMARSAEARSSARSCSTRDSITAPTEVARLAAQIFSARRTRSGTSKVSLMRSAISGIVPALSLWLKRQHGRFPFYDSGLLLDKWS